MNQRKTGIIISYITLAIHSIIGLIYVPMLLHYLTQAEYGIYQLMGSVVAYLSVMEFGLSNTTTRYVARALSLKDEKETQHVISVSHTLYLGIAVLLFITGTIFYFCIDPVYSSALTAGELHTAKQIYVIMLINMVVMVQAHVFTAVINAHEHFVFIQGLNLIKVISQPLLVWAILAWKASALNVVLAQSVIIWVGFLCNYIYCKSKLKLSFPLQLTKNPLFKELLGFSFFIFLHIIMDQMFYRSGQLILGAVSGAQAVAIYAITIQVIAFAITLPSSVNGMFLPKLSASIATQKNLIETNTIFCKLGRLQFMLFMLIFTGFAFLGRIFIDLWVGKGYEIVYWLVMALMGGYILEVSQSIGNAALQAMKKHAFRAYVYTAMAVLNIALAIPLAKKYGPMGCAISTVLCLWLGPGLTMNLYYRHLGIDIKTFFKNIGKLMCVIVPIVVMLLGLFLCWPVKTTILSFIAHGSVLTIIYSSMLWKFAFNEYEKNLVLQPLARLKTILKIESKFH